MPRKIIQKSDALILYLLLAFIVVLSGCSTKIGKDEFGSLPGISKLVLTPDSTLTRNFDIGIPESTLDILACIKCHNGLKVNTKRRVLTGTHIDYVFDHPGFTTEVRWCYSCHYTGSFELLRLETGKLVTYQKAYELCMQCHITKYADWEAGIHGKRTGEWNGKKQYQ